MTALDTSATDAQERFDRILGELRPKLHRYCARMTGSVIDGEDVVQEAIVKAIEAYPRTRAILHLEGWLFRITHNAALDFLRRRARQEAIHADEDPSMIVDPTDAAQDRQIVATSLRTFMRLPLAQRSSVILKDVLGYSLEEIGSVFDSGVPAIKAALHRGRARLRALAEEPEDSPVPVLAEPERSLLAAYIRSFNARDFDAIGSMLADEIQLELVTRMRLKGRAEVAGYFTNYTRLQDWRLVPGFVDRRPAALVCHPNDLAGRPGYFVLLEWSGPRLGGIRDFYYARYVTDGAEMIIADGGLR